MKPSRFLRDARRRAAVSQRELARRTGVPQATISRIERGRVSPSTETLARLLDACGQELVAVERPGRGLDRTLIAEKLRLAPGDRARRAAAEWAGTEVLRRAARRAR